MERDRGGRERKREGGKEIEREGERERVGYEKEESTMKCQRQQRKCRRQNSSKKFVIIQSATRCIYKNPTQFRTFWSGLVKNASCPLLGTVVFVKPFKTGVYNRC